MGSQTEEPVPPPGGVLWWADADCKGSSLGLWWGEPARHPPRSSPDHTNTSGPLKQANVFRASEPEVDEAVRSGARVFLEHRERASHAMNRGRFNASKEGGPTSSKDRFLALVTATLRALIHDSFSSGLTARNRRLGTCKDAPCYHPSSTSHRKLVVVVTQLRLLKQEGL